MPPRRSPAPAAGSHSCHRPAEWVQGLSLGLSGAEVWCKPMSSSVRMPNHGWEGP